MKIKLIWISVIFALVAIESPSEAAEFLGTIIAVQGNDVTVRVESAGNLQPAVGDVLSIMERPNEQGNALSVPGEWVITEIKRHIVKAVGKILVPGLRPKVNMQAFINISPPVYSGEESAAKPDKKIQSIAMGKVIMLREKDVTIQLAKGQPDVSVDDAVEISFTVTGEVIPVGTWRVSALKGDGIIEAKPLALEGEPTIDMDARVFTDASKKKTKVEFGKKPDRPIRKKTEIDDKSPLETACLNGDATECNELGKMYDAGLGGLPKDLSRAVEFFRRTCDGGSAEGCSYLGLKYVLGKGVNQDNKLAVHYLKKACDGGDTIACSHIGDMYVDGKGVDRDYGRAIEYYKKGCDGGDYKGCSSLGTIYYNGYGTAIDQDRGKYFMEKACKMGHEWSCNKLKEL